MKINFDQTFKGVAGPGAENLNLASVSFQALNATPPDARASLSLDEAWKRGKLAMKIMDGGEHDLSVDDLALIRRQLPLVWTPIIVAQAADMLDPS